MTGAPGRPPERTFTGGLWSAAGNAIWPLARLELLDWGIRVAGQRPRAAVAGPGVGGQVGGTHRGATRLGSHSQPWRVPADRHAADSAVFWSRRGTTILDHLQVHGVPADHSVTRLPWGANAHHP
jgi:hypothetical protein